MHASNGSEPAASKRILVADDNRDGTLPPPGPHSEIDNA